MFASLSIRVTRASVFTLRALPIRLPYAQTPYFCRQQAGKPQDDEARQRQEANTVSHFSQCYPKMPRRA